MKKPVKRVVVVHDICCFGKAALTNIIPVLSVMGVEVCPIPTMLLSTHTGGFGMPEILKLPDFIKKCDNHYSKLGIEFDKIFVGYLGTKEIVRNAIDFIKNNNSYTIIDPIFGDNGVCYSNFDMDYVNAQKELIGYADLITPNYTEACLLTDEDYNEEASLYKIERICNKLKEMGAKDILITSIPIENSKEIGIAVFEDGKLFILNKERKEENYPGTGDIFTSVVIGKLLKGFKLIESVDYAHKFVLSCIEKSLKYDYPKKEGVMLEANLKYLID